MPITRAKVRSIGATGILDHAVAVDPIGSDETSVSSGVPAPDQPDRVDNARAMRHRASDR
jgi:hypothetical protein